MWDDTTIRGIFQTTDSRAQYLIWWLAFLGGGSVWEQNGKFFIVDAHESPQAAWTRFRLDDRELARANEAIAGRLDQEEARYGLEHTLGLIIAGGNSVHGISFVVDPRLAKADIWQKRFPPDDQPGRGKRTFRGVLQETLTAVGCEFEVKWGAVYISPARTKADGVGP